MTVSTPAPKPTAAVMPVSLSEDLRIGLSLLTFFWGAGKTTLLRKLLSEDDMHGTGIIINEFGEASLDHLLVLMWPLRWWSCPMAACAVWCDAIWLRRCATVARSQIFRALCSKHLV